MAGYKAAVLHENDYRTTQWSGGTTTELSIAPAGSIYADRDFRWRISSATVELEESDFTSLPDYDRIIMTLKGGIRLSHNKGTWISLPEFSPHSFDGGDETASVGKVIDFNLMMRKGVCAGDMVSILLKSGERCLANKRLPGKIEDFNTVMLYCYEGNMTVLLESGEEYELSSGSSLKLEGAFENVCWTCEAKTDVSAVIAAVHDC